MKSNVPYRAITLTDVAREAGVSRITASRALSNPSLVTQATIEKVRAAVDATGYIPNLLAGGLKSNRSMTVAGLVPIISAPQFLPTVKALTETLASNGYQLILGQSGYNNVNQDKLISTMIGRRPDGIVVTGAVQSKEARVRLRSLNIPVVETWELSDDPVDMSIGFSHLAVGNAVARYFLSKGWTHCGTANGSDRRAQLRVQGFMEAMGNDVVNSVVPAPSSVELGRKAGADLLERAPGLRAVFCSSDNLAHGVMLEAQSRGIRIPDELAICGFGDAEFAAHLLPSLTTVQVDGPEIGRLAAELILDRCKGKAPASKVIDLGYKIVQRGTTE
ncbi:LacI family DNA-binding transcriptional regulator [Pseudolabrys sp. FHR47]|uniref:LacI family DNA-binding transcriptional regulator n=1 Tax=Pseudolabrys sp. FHR47 TaxID=2562284 RepID=UPI0010BEBD71|nr:LacI family DNA-binding transcriptional regulator [Pseudolabrys sp. FHR47]